MSQDLILADPADFDPMQLAGVQDPYPLFAALHRAGPSVQTHMGFRVVVGYDACNQVLRDKRFQSGLIAQRFRDALPAGAAQDELAHRINFLDPPDHTRVRGLIMRAFTPARIRDMRAWVEAKADELLEAVAPRLDTGETVDLREALAHDLPSHVISQMLGVPLADRDTLTAWTEAVAPLLSTQVDPARLEVALEASERFAAYAADLIAARRANPGDDLLTAMLAPDESDDQLTRPELLSLTVTLYSAGHRTTRDSFANGLFSLLRHPDQLAAVAADPALVPAAVSEFLRFETPTLYVARIPTEPVDIAGEDVGPFTPTLVFLAAANRDPRTYPDPDRFDIARFGPQGAAPAPLSFAAGPHHCLGAALARMEAEVMLSAVVRRWPKLRPAGPPPSWWQSGPFRGIDRLDVVAA